jgi:hypothetical protein
VQVKKVDNQIHESTAQYIAFKKDMAKSKKRLDLLKITAENQRMLRRIQDVPPAYNHVEWNEHAKINEKFKRSMALYPEYYERPENQENSMQSRSPSMGDLADSSLYQGSVGRGSFSNLESWKRN